MDMSRCLEIYDLALFDGFGLYRATTLFLMVHGEVFEHYEYVKFKYRDLM